MNFCQQCESVLITQQIADQNYFSCYSCQTQIPIQSCFSKCLYKNQGQRVNIENVFKQNEGLQKITVQCQKCDSQEAFYYQMQTRSADEASTIFYKCVKCGESWKDN